MTALGTRICRSRFPAWITTSAVITFATLPIGRSVSRPRLHSRPPVAAFASTPPFAFTPLGMPVTCKPGGAGRGVGFARAVWAACVAAARRAAARSAAAAWTLTPTEDFDGADDAADHPIATPARMLLAAAVAVSRTATCINSPVRNVGKWTAREYPAGLSHAHRQPAARF